MQDTSLLIRLVITQLLFSTSWEDRAAPSESLWTLKHMCSRDKFSDSPSLSLFPHHPLSLPPSLPPSPSAPSLSLSLALALSLDISRSLPPSLSVSVSAHNPLSLSSSMSLCLPFRLSLDLSFPLSPLSESTSIPPKKLLYKSIYLSTFVCLSFFLFLSL